MNIFLRELRPFWTRADPTPLPTVERLAKHLSTDLNRYSRKSLVFARVEAGLIRRRREIGLDGSTNSRWDREHFFRRDPVSGAHKPS
ncbi:hypothetical protein KMZ93_20410 [Bradyrhizobium sediminis]|uniref:Uncharacterized protein n=1 Tax=Bradyrhizobium sediminis TaxID=2840469 RepID=A0A975S0C9_9BRAD|nr:hypothetical protein [Bradyrhizobium sediminis]QWG26158.1 hypothetical protein KMZ93_20410 [Bradyrhizobium sediminis]